MNATRAAVLCLCSLLLTDRACAIPSIWVDDILTTQDVLVAEVAWGVAPPPMFIENDFAFVEHGGHSIYLSDTSRALGIPMAVYIQLSTAWGDVVNVELMSWSDRAFATADLWLGKSDSSLDSIVGSADGYGAKLVLRNPAVAVPEGGKTLSLLAVMLVVLLGTSLKSFLPKHRKPRNPFGDSD